VTPAVDETANGAGGPTLDEGMLAAAQQAHERPARGEGSPQILAKGLERSAPVRPLVYSSPSLDQAGPEVRSADSATPSEDDAAKPAARPNPNRGSRGNRSNAGRRRRG
jgi:preprotein translocase subunit SecA